MSMFQRLNVLIMKYSMTASNTSASGVVQTLGKLVLLEIFAIQDVSARTATFERAILASSHRNAMIVL
jgi:hypothetical protein